MKKILFSPIGTADPMTNLGDGPMLHIVRHCSPDTVVLFLSPKMAEYHDADNRYVRAIEDCCDLLEKRLPEITVFRSTCDDVHRFDYYIEEFESALKGVKKEDDDCEIIVNVTSGTPGMQQALVSLGAFGQLGMRMLQVSTPRKDANRKGDREDPNSYEYERLWADNPDNVSGCECRIEEVETPNFSEQLLRKEILALVAKYDYAGAAELAKSSTGMTQETKDLIRATSSRSNLAKNKPREVFGRECYRGTEIEFNANNQLYEYLSVLEIRLKQGHYADFVRALTPALTETMLNLLDAYLPREKYLTDESLQDRFYKFDSNKLEEDPELFEFLKGACKVDFGRYSAPFLTNGVLANLFDRYFQGESQQKKVNQLRKFEYKIRNLIAHQISKMDKNFIEEKGRMSLDKVLALMFELNGFNKGLYDRINEEIFEKLQ